MRRLIVFVKAPQIGLVKTRLASSIGEEAACAAYRQLVEIVLQQVSSLDEVTLQFTPDNAGDELKPWLRKGWRLEPQGGGDLGCRLNVAFEQAFDEGMERVVIIGSDCPEVGARDIEDAWLALQTHQMIIGPATDGGYWLIGLNQLRPELFQGMRWSNAEVFPETIRRAEMLGLNFKVLRELGDVDTEIDWRQFLEKRNAASLRR